MKRNSGGIFRVLFQNGWQSACMLAVGILIISMLLAACSSSSNTPAASSPTQAIVVDSTSTALPVQAEPTNRTTVAPTQPSTKPSAPAATTAPIKPAATQTQPQAAGQTKTLAPTQPMPASFPDPSKFEWRSIASGLERPVLVTDAGDGSGRLFIIEQAGRILILQKGQVLQTPFLDIRSEVGSRGNEQGLLGLAFNPKYSQNGYFYVNYTDLKGDTNIARFQVSKNDPNQADPSSETRLLFVDQPYANHNGGEVTFGPDGYLYLGLGDGGSQGDPKNNAQSLNTFLGKILRIDVNQGDPYSTPKENRFADGQLPEIWAYGLRNPWRFSFDRQTGDLYIGDVGQNLWEEIDFLPANSPAGTDFGWAIMEGNHPYKDVAPPLGAKLTPPVAEYNHSDGCSVTGGFVYRGSQLPEWNGVYLYSDYCSGWIRGLIHTAQGEWQNKQLYSNLGNISSFGEDQSGELYAVDLGGSIYQLVRK